MTRRVLTDEIWPQLLAVMESKGCYDSKNAREVMETEIIENDLRIRSSKFKPTKPLITKKDKLIS